MVSELLYSYMYKPESEQDKFVMKAKMRIEETIQTKTGVECFVKKGNIQI